MQLIDFTQLILACSSVVTPTLAIVGFIELHRKTTGIANQVEIVRHETNSMKDELVESVRKASLAKGRLDKEKEIEKDQDTQRGT